tara:strand:- start:112 stop:642 length:531 start_codon:yes stop_codon:yes gene_type:complete
MIIEDNNFLTREQKYHIDNVILGANFPWFYSSLVKDTNNSYEERPYFHHVVLRRPELREPNELYNSHHSEFCINVLNSFCKKNRIKYEEIYRINFNCDFNNGYESCMPHEDHPFPHQQLLVYLNNSSNNSYTVIKNKNQEIKIKPEKYKGISFEKKIHYHYYPKQGRRVVLVMTFN